MTFGARSEFLMLQDCPVHHRMFGSFPGHYLLDASHTSTLEWWLISKTSPDITKYSMGGKKTLAENQWSSADRPSHLVAVLLVKKCFPEVPRLSPLSHWLNPGHSPIAEPITGKGVEYPWGQQHPLELGMVRGGVGAVIMSMERGEEAG